MTPGVHDIEIYQGDTFELFFRIREEDGTYVDLTGRTARAQIRPTTESTIISAEFTAVIPDQTVVANRGSVLLRLSPGQTAALATGGVWDVQLTTTATGDISTYLRGAVSIVKEVTKA